MSLEETFYHNLPVPLQHVICSWMGFKLKRGRLHQAVLKEFIQSGELDHDTWCRIRDVKLAAFVEHAARTVPFYRNWFREQCADPRDIQTLDDLKALPIITKAIIKTNPAAFRSEEVPRFRCKIIQTSGTTGARLDMPVTAASLKIQWAVWWRYRFWHGINPKTSNAFFTPRAVVRGNSMVGPF